MSHLNVITVGAVCLCVHVSDHYTYKAHSSLVIFFFPLQAEISSTHYVMLQQ